jgi:hypothetical protein
MTENVLRISYSERKTYKTCQRKWWLSYVRRLALIRETPSAASLGTRVHNALEIHYNPDDTRDPLAVFEQQAAADLASPDLHEKTPAEIELARVMVTGYFEWLEETGADEDLELLAAETQVEMPLEGVRDLDGNPVVAIGKIDARVRRRSDGAVMFVDHKTVLSFEERTRLLHLDEQMKGYHVLERHNAAEGQRVDGAIYNMIRKVKRGPRAKPPFYDRAEVRHNDRVLDAYRRQLVAETREIIHTRAALRLDNRKHYEIVPPNPGRDCAWSCEFLPVCPMFDDSSMAADRVLEQHYTRKNPLERYDRPTDTPPA